MNKTQVYIDSRVNILYNAFYIEALQNHYGKQNVYFSLKPFAELTPRWSMLFVVKFKGIEKRYVIDPNDSYIIDEALYAWSDVYGIINGNINKTPSHLRDKLKILCPSFGVRYGTSLELATLGFLNLIRSGNNRQGLTRRKFLGKYKRCIQRPLLKVYTQESVSLDNYIFFCSTLWYNSDDNGNDEGVNLRRARFIRACKKCKCTFEGGLVSQGKKNTPWGEFRSSDELFADCLTKGVNIKEYIEKTKRSAVVFNTPAFWNCHGWKLGEYLAMGKAIISTPLSNDLPYPLEHGKNVHFVEDSEESMQEAITYILSHPEYKRKLETGAREYWENCGTQEKSLELLGIK